MTIDCIYCVNGKHHQCTTPDLCACAKANHKRKELVPA